MVASVLFSNSLKSPLSLKATGPIFELIRFYRFFLFEEIFVHTNDFKK